MIRMICVSFHLALTSVLSSQPRLSAYLLPRATNSRCFMILISTGSAALPRISRDPPRLTAIRRASSFVSNLAGTRAFFICRSSDQFGIVSGRSLRASTRARSHSMTTRPGYSIAIVR
jgi:hypothetical protein